jgi:hypothetical protein
MKSQISALKLLVSISLVLIISSCEEDENPTKASDDKILTYGNFFYTLVGGFDQEGTSGQFLDKEIRLMITNLEGKPVNRNIEVSISDPTGEVLDISGYDSDTITIKWRLGCADIDQVLTFKDRNVCGVAKDDCIDIDLFQIKINPYNEFIEGWYTPCNTYSHNANKYLVSDERIFFKNSVRAFLSSEPYTKNWNRINIPSGMSSGRFNMFFTFLQQAIDQLFWSNSCQTGILVMPSCSVSLPSLCRLSEHQNQLIGTYQGVYGTGWGCQVHF